MKISWNSLASPSVSPERLRPSSDIVQSSKCTSGHGAFGHEWLPSPLTAGGDKTACPAHPRPPDAPAAFELRTLFFLPPTLARASVESRRCPCLAARYPDPLARRKGRVFFIRRVTPQATDNPSASGRRTAGGKRRGDRFYSKPFADRRAAPCACRAECRQPR